MKPIVLRYLRYLFKRIGIGGEASDPAYHKGIISPSGTRERSTRQTKTKQKKEQLVTVNIKIRKDQKEWLTDTASTVRDNNTEPVPPAQRVYPQHLIGVAIDLLQNVDVDWGEIKNVEELREHLNL